MSFKKPLFIQNINPKAVFTIVIWLIVAWVLSRPLHGIGQHIYELLGTLTSSTFQNISKTKSNAEDLLKSKVLVSKQAKTISLLKIKMNYLENQIKETENLKGLLNLKRSLSYKTVCTNVIGRSADNWHKQIILDKGKEYNIMLGDSVLSAKGIIGQVVDVDKNISIVQLISDPSYKLGCKIAKKNILGILTGKTNSISIIQFIPVGSNVKTGDLVITSGIATGGLQPTYPTNHPIGKVSKVSKKKSKTSDLYIEVKLSEDLNSLSDVLVFSPN
ncbi:MAG: rod shape-determining protein MreC [Candidatus Melainabacteria bacterium]|nr:rod shape-determining protein MreC [Candidatus Melainabacteria bacterium]